MVFLSSPKEKRRTFKRDKTSGSRWCTPLKYIVWGEKKKTKKCMRLENNALARDELHSFWCRWITSKLLERSSFVFLSFPCHNRLMFSCHRTFPWDACMTKSNLPGTGEIDFDHMEDFSLSSMIKCLPVDNRIDIYMCPCRPDSRRRTLTKSEEG